MKRMKIQKVNAGEMFSVFGDTFVALDHVDGGVLAIRKDIWKNAPFDRDGKNDFRRASIKNDLIDYLIGLWKNGANWESAIVADIDLKATDGTREYGFFRTGAALLTLEQYGKYQHIIPEADGLWWLATPHIILNQKHKNISSVWCVGSSGYSTLDCACNNGIRPALVFAPSLLVEYDDGGEDQDGTEEEALYEKYIEHLFDWLANWGEVCGVIGESPLSYDEWKEQEKADE